MKPWKTLKGLLVHPKDKQSKEDITECVYKVPCANCNKTYVGETGRKLGVRLQEHKKEVDSRTNRAFTRSQRTASLTEHNKSVLTDHATQENHLINWSDGSIIDREPDRLSRWIKEAVHVRKDWKASVQSTEMRGASPSATVTTVFLTRSFRNVSRTGSTEYQLHLMKVSDRDRNVNKKS